MRIESTPMNPVRSIGLILLLGGVALLPIGLAYTRWMIALSIIAISMGLLLLMAARDREIEDAVSNAGSEKQGAQIQLGTAENKNTLPGL